MPRLILRLLGAPQIELNEQAIATDRRKAIALLAYLAVTGSRHSRETLAALFWPDYDQSQAFAYLRRTVWELNHALGEGWIESDRDTVGLTNGSEWQLDVSRFLELTNQWKAAVNGSGDAIDLLSEAVSMYRGDFLAGFTLRDSPDFDEWQVFQSENLRRRFGEALETLAGGYRERGDLDSAIDVARRWLALDPLNEPAHRELMRLYIKAGQRSAALRQYEECVRILHEELNVSPEPETTELYKQIKDSTRRAVQGLKVNEQPSSRLRPSNLPKPSTPFIGREKELAEILSLLADPNCRLLTLAGSGGIGKTRLSIRAAETQLDDYPHGVYFVSLAPLYSTDSLLLAIADTIGFTFYGRSARGETVQDPKLQLLEYLREKKMLLVMDNFEHLLDSAELLAKIAAAAPMVKFLVTSRERLNLPGEWVLDIQGMSYPDDGPSEAWEAYPAVELFLQSARRAQANFVLANSDRLHINRICQLVDGMPLGIELAAAWVKMMSCQEIAQEIEKSLDFLMTSLRGVPERHRSIRAVFEHSWNLMSEGEREALRRLSVFRCGFQREAAGRVAEATLARLSALTDKSILRRGPSGRWDLHEVLKQYAAAKLDETPAEKTDTNQRHSEYYLGLLGQLNGKLRGPAAREAIEQIEEEYENIRLAWSWAVNHEEMDQIRAAIIPLLVYHTVSHRELESAEVFQAAVDAAKRKHSQAPSDLLAKLTMTLLTAIQSQIHSFMDEDEEAQSLRKTCLEMAVSLPATLEKGIALMLIDFGYGLIETSDSLQLYWESLEIFRNLGDSWAAGLAHQNWAGIAMQREFDPLLARHLYQEGLEIFRELGDRFGMTLCLNGLAFVAYWIGEYDEARRLSLECIDIIKETKDPWAMMSIRLALGQIAVDLGEYEEAIRNYRENIAFLKEMGQRRLLAVHYDCLGYVEYLRGHYDTAEQLDLRSLDLYGQIGDRNGIAMALNNLGDNMQALGDYAKAREYYLESLEMLTEQSNHWAVTKCLKNLGRLSFARGEYEQSNEYYRQALQSGVQSERLSEMLEIFFGLARLAAQEQNLERAIEILALVESHPAVTREVRQEAEQMLAVVEDQVQGQLNGDEIQAIKQRGKAKDLSTWLAEF